LSAVRLQVAFDLHRRERLELEKQEQRERTKLRRAARAKAKEVALQEQAEARREAGEDLLGPGGGDDGEGSRASRGSKGSGGAGGSAGGGGGSVGSGASQVERELEASLDPARLRAMEQELEAAAPKDSEFMPAAATFNVGTIIGGTAGNILARAIVAELAISA
jgi:hypothetical protein